MSSPYYQLIKELIESAPEEQRDFLWQFYEETKSGLFAAGGDSLESLLRSGQQAVEEKADE